MSGTVIPTPLPAASSAPAFDVDVDLEGLSAEATIAGALISIGVWLAMARRTRRGRPGVRIMSTILFGIDCLTVARTFSHGLVTGPTWIIGVAEWGIGLTVIVFLWDRRSSAYFAQQRQARSLATPQWGPARTR